MIFSTIFIVCSIIFIDINDRYTFKLVKEEVLQGLIEMKLE